MGSHLFLRPLLLAGPFLAGAGFFLEMPPVATPCCIGKKVFQTWNSDNRQAQLHIMQRANSGDIPGILQMIQEMSILDCQNQACQTLEALIQGA